MKRRAPLIVEETLAKAPRSSGTVITPDGSNILPEKSLDEGFYSRQIYVLGKDAMSRMANSDILICGLGGLGVEVAKNIILGGVKSVTLHDTSKCTMEDLASQFFLTEGDVGKNRAVACVGHLTELNPYVQVNSHTVHISNEFLKSFRAVVLTNTSLREQLNIASITAAYNIPLVIASTKGLFAQVFCDFGPEFKVVDPTGENPVSVMVASISKEKEGVVTVSEDSRHGLEDGDYVTFSEVKGMTELNHGEPKEVHVLGPFTFSIGDTSKFSDYTRGGIATQVKIPKVFNFKTLPEALLRPKFVISDSAKIVHAPQLHLAFKALHRFEENYSTKPRPWNREDAEKLVTLANAIVQEERNNIDVDTDLIKLFSKVSSGSLCPMNTFIGGIVAQEVMKACSGKFSPIDQWLYFDAIECLPESKEVAEADAQPTNSRYDGQTAVFGKNFQVKLGSLNYFVVGAGAVGCELLKNFAMMGVGVDERGGQITVTDMDHIERSNLNRQFLFRQHDVNKPKSVTAANAIRRMNPTVNVVAHENRVCAETENIYNDTFFENLDGIANALDNMEARVYMDMKCVRYRKPLLESGTQGTKGNTQVVVPFKTESYFSSLTRDPPEMIIPQCTLKGFPSAVEHTLEWSREQFEGFFSHPARNAYKYINNPDFVNQTLNLPGMQPVETLKTVRTALVEERPKNFLDCVKWARDQWQEQYCNNICKILTEFPPDELAFSGQPFWSYPKRCPKPLVFSINDPLHLDYVFAAANLKAQVYRIPQNRNKNEVAQIVSQFKHRSRERVHVYNVEQLISNATGKNQDQIDILINHLPPLKQLEGLQIHPLEFEKDDDTNLHIDFIHAASNLRASNYNIPQTDRLTSKLIAGKIIPAIATTTSVVAGLVGFELIKLTQGNKRVEAFKNGFVNLALPMFDFSEPIAAPKMSYQKWTIWDRFQIDQELTLQQLIDYFHESYGLIITMVSQGVYVLYSYYMEQKGSMSLPITKVVETVSKKPIEPHVQSLVLDLCCMDVEFNEIDEVPYVLYNLC